MKTFFPYYGSKYNAVKKYQEPVHDTIIEPFAGSACYAVRHHDKVRKVILYDINPVVAGVWRYLIKATPKDIMDLPYKLEDVMNLNKLNISEEEKNLIGFWLVRGSSTPNMIPSKWMMTYVGGEEKKYTGSFWGEEVRKRIADQVPLIKEWEIYEESYKGCDNIEATYFVDPPYSTPPGKSYKCPLKPEDFKELGEWCESRKGQVIVCEQETANWLDFQVLGKLQSLNKRYDKSSEVVWYNLKKEDYEKELKNRKSNIKFLKDNNYW